MNKTFHCEAYHDDFDVVSDPDDVAAEAVANGWGNLRPDQMATVCEDCYIKIMQGMFN